MITSNNLDPVIVFSFSRADCEDLALQVQKLDLNNEEETSTIHQIATNALSKLSETERKLPAITTIMPLLERGIGVHHSGLLPIVKELVEILFQEGLIKVLFATETFSIGLNMPAKTVVFTSVKKYDGLTERWISGGEYIQMSGRAGRRGLDDRGIVVMKIDQTMDSAVAMGMVKGESDKLNSAFHLTYSMILNLLRIEGITPEFMMEHSFYQFQAGENLIIYESKQQELKNKIDLYQIDDEDEVSRYYGMQQQAQKLVGEVKNVVNKPENCLQFLETGRLVQVNVKGLDFGWGTVVSTRKFQPKNNLSSKREDILLIKCLVWISVDSPINQQRKDSPILIPEIKPAESNIKGKMEIITITPDSIYEIGALRVQLPKELVTTPQRRSIKKSIEEIKKRFPDGIPVLDPVENMKIIDNDFFSLLKKAEILEIMIHDSPINSLPNLEKKYNLYAQKQALLEEEKQIKAKISNLETISNLDELRNRKRVLRQLGFTNQNDVVQLKGRVACEISNGDELVITELLFSGVLNELEPSVIASLLSCFVSNEQSKIVPVLSDQLKGLYNNLRETAKKVARVFVATKLQTDVAAYIDSFKPHLMLVVYQWCEGASFLTVSKMTDMYTGSIVRVLKRLEELIRQIMEGCRVMGDLNLVNRMERTMELVNRDVVAIQSLYL